MRWSSAPAQIDHQWVRPLDYYELLIAALRKPLLRLILLIDADPSPPDFPVQFAWTVQEAKRIKQGPHLGNSAATPIHIAPLHIRLVQQTGGGVLPTAILAKATYT